MDDFSIRAWFDTQIATALQTTGVDTATQVAWPGMQFDSEAFPEHLDWYLPKVSLGEPGQSELGSAGQNESFGVMQVTLFGRISDTVTVSTATSTPTNMSEQDFISLMYPLISAFKRGTTYQGATPAGEHFCIHMEKAWVFDSARDTQTGRWAVTVRAKFQVFMDN